MNSLLLNEIAFNQCLKKCKVVMKIMDWIGLPYQIAFNQCLKKWTNIKPARYLKYQPWFTAVKLFK